MENNDKQIILKKICDYLNYPVEDSEVSRLDDINADLITFKEHRRGCCIIIGDDGSYLTCGSLYPLEHYIEEYKNGVRETFLEDPEAK